MKISIVIASRGVPLGLWATVMSCYEDLRTSHTHHEYEFVIVTNGGLIHKDGKRLITFLKDAGVLGGHIHSDEALAPPVARQRGVEVSTGDVIFFFDDHCVLGQRYFDRAMQDFETGKIDVLHSTTQYNPGEDMHYHYNLGLEYNFWTSGSSRFPKEQRKAYPVAMAGHGGFAVTRAAWNKVGGYGPEKLLTGYGGEEPLFDLKIWRMGLNVYLNPVLIHYHYAGTRGYDRHFTNEYYMNMLSSAYVIGGEKWLCTVFDSFITKNHLRAMKGPYKSHWDLLLEAEERSRDYSKYLDSVSVRTLDESLTYFKETGVAT